MLLKSYGISKVTGDHYGGEWPRERFRVAGIAYEPAERPESDYYRDALPLLNAGRVELLDHARLTAQLIGLERRTAHSGRDSIDHAPGAHDDVANAVAGALTLAATTPVRFRVTEGMRRLADKPGRRAIRRLAEGVPVSRPRGCFGGLCVVSRN